MYIFINIHIYTCYAFPWIAALLLRVKHSDMKHYI